jgi:serine/threonine protein kinase
MHSHTAAHDLDELLGQVATEFFERLSRGETPDIDEYVRRYPAIAPMIRHALPALQVVNDSLMDSSIVVGPHDEKREKRLGDFRILNELGRGGMGVVYEAEQISMGVGAWP